MVPKQILTRYNPLLNPNNFSLILSQIRTTKNSSLTPSSSLLSKNQPPFTIHKSPDMTHATTLNPTDVKPRGPCPPPVLSCPPPPCACPPPPEVITLGRQVLRVLWFLTKLGVFVAVVKLTIDEGLWGTSEESEDMAKRLGLLSDEQDEQKDEEKKESSSSSPSPKEMWNALVLRVGQLIGLKP